MQTSRFRPVLAPATLGLPLGVWSLLLLAACSGTSDNPYSALKNPPLVSARLHDVILVADNAAASERIVQAGYAPTPLAPNYQQANAVEGSLWGVPEPVAEKVQYYKAAAPGAPGIRLLVMPLAARGRSADAATERAFFRHVLDTEVPVWPLAGKPDDGLRVQVWTYRVANILEANQRLRENGIPVIFDPVAITTSYLGDYKTLAIRAPDGTVVQLVEAAAQ